jgi:type IV secretion system protein VirD4
VNDDFYRQYAYGSSRLGGREDALTLTKGGGPIGRFEDIILRFRSEEPTIVLGGAGSGKGANLGIYQPVHPSTGSFFILDVSGQYMSTTWHHNLAEGRDAYALNVEGIGAYPDINHRLNFWGILKEDKYLFDNTRRIAAMALIDNSKGDNSWVYTGARRWLTRIMILLVLLEGRVTPKRLWEFINRIDCDDEYLKEWGRASEHIPYEVYSTMAEIYRKKQTAEKEYGAIMGKIKDDLDWLSSPSVAESISGDEDYLSYLADPAKKVGIYYALAGGSGPIMESLTRMVTGIGMLHCMRAGKGARPLFYIEEAATLGKADFVKQAVSECRKYFHTVLVYQSRGQLEFLFTKAGATEILDSCGQHIILGGGLRDHASARVISDTIGKATIYVDDPMAQADRAYKADSAIYSALWHGQDLIDAARTYEHESMQSAQRRQMGRDVLTPSELMRLKDKVLILTPGLGLPPILAEKMPNYWENPAMVGRYGPDPLFPPLDRVVVPRRHFWNKGERPFIREAVPEHLADMPNHSNGQIAYVKGYKTW